MSRQNFSRRELEVAELIVEERSPKEIAEELHISQSTVYTHIHRLEEKTGTTDQDSLITWFGYWLPERTLQNY